MAAQNQITVTSPLLPNLEEYNALPPRYLEPQVDYETMAITISSWSKPLPNTSVCPISAFHQRNTSAYHRLCRHWVSPKAKSSLHPIPLSHQPLYLVEQTKTRLVDIEEDTAA